MEPTLTRTELRDRINVLPTVQHPQQAVTVQIEPPKVWANDNKTNDNSKAVTKPLVPDSDVQRFYRERIVAAPEGSSLTSTELYEEYCAWCEENNKEPFAHPRVTREIGELGVQVRFQVGLHGQSSRSASAMNETSASTGGGNPKRS